MIIGLMNELKLLKLKIPEQIWLINE